MLQWLVDDKRNTDNAWVETTCFNFHDNESLFHRLKLKSIDPSLQLEWVVLQKGICARANHNDYLERVSTP
jgi:transient receptor potential cation channel subfamily M protein 2